MKTIAKLIYQFFIWMDEITKKYEGYSYETAPYCGHSYSGHDGFFTCSRFHESDGGGKTKGWFHRYILGVWYSNVEGEQYGFSLPVYNHFRWLYYELKRWFKGIVIKIEYPYGKRTLYIKFVTIRPKNYNYRESTMMTLHIFRMKGYFPISHSSIVI